MSEPKRAGRKPLAAGAVYESDNADMGELPPFTEYMFIVLESFVDEKDGFPSAKVLFVEGDHVFRPGATYLINPAYWVWTGAWRIA